MTDPERTQPRTPCPEWCVEHVDGHHVAHLELKDVVKGSNIYVRPVDHGEGQVGLQLIVAQVEGPQTTYIDLTPEMLTEHAEYAALQDRLTRQRKEQPGN